MHLVRVKRIQFEDEESQRLIYQKLLDSFLEANYDIDCGYYFNIQDCYFYEK